MSEQFPSNVEIRAWASSKPGGESLNRLGNLPRFVILAWNKAHPDRPYVRGKAWHGTRGGYTRHGCRCERCSRAESEYGANYYTNGGPGRWDS